MTTETPRKRLMVPVCEQPYALVTGELGGKLTFYGPTPLHDTPDGFCEARTLLLDHYHEPWQCVELRDLGELDAIDGDNGIPDSPIEDKRNEFLAMMAASRRLDMEGRDLIEQARETNEPGRTSLREDGESLCEQGRDLAEQALALAEELLA